MLHLLIPIIIAQQSLPPVVTVDHDNTEITESCTIRIAANPILDSDNNGVIHITHEGITVDFDGQHMHGATAGYLPDSFAGFGITIAAKNVTLTNAMVSGFKVGIHAVNADGLTIHDCDVSNNFHQHLKSTTQAEDGSDWLWPHANDNHEWMINYGAGICIEDSSNVTIHDVKARKTQNGIILDRVNDSKVYDCDCSFLSGWGLAMWRSNRNVISRNAFDFCVRGYSHGVYNRGQDSAGILMFEQCCQNRIIENSVTHGGDGLFAFAGNEALGQVDRHEDLDWYKSRGCNNNQFLMNAFSYSAAHGLEMTFSFANEIRGNAFEENAICGIWGGYSHQMSISGNDFAANGTNEHGRERGGINIEHGSRVIIDVNIFRDNSAAISLWWDDDGELLKTPWALANGHQSDRNFITHNSFLNNDTNIELSRTTQTFLAQNQVTGNAPEVTGDESSLNSIIRSNETTSGPCLYAPVIPLGNTNPTLNRKHLAGRDTIIMTEWGPWDHESPLLRFVRWFDHADEYRLLGAKTLPIADGVSVKGEVSVEVQDNLLRVRPKHDNTLTPYAISLAVDGEQLSARHTVATGAWEVWTFASASDPREDVEKWRREGTADHHTLTADNIDFRFGTGGMSDARHLPAVLPRDHFGVIATRSLTIPAGKWRIKTVSDDGIRVWMNDHLIIDDWTWHGPTRHDYEFEMTEPREHAFRVEYFELDGYAVLSVEFEKVEAAR